MGILDFRLRILTARSSRNDSSRGIHGEIAVILAPLDYICAKKACEYMQTLSVSISRILQPEVFHAAQHDTYNEKYYESSRNQLTLSTPYGRAVIGEIIIEIYTFRWYTHIFYSY